MNGKAGQSLLSGRIMNKKNLSRWLPPVLVALMVLLFLALRTVSLTPVPSEAQSGAPSDAETSAVSAESEDAAAAEAASGGAAEIGAAGADGGLTVAESGEYTGKDEVALYIHQFGHLPSNYITRQEA